MAPHTRPILLLIFICAIAAIVLQQWRLLSAAHDTVGLDSAGSSGSSSTTTTTIVSATRTSPISSSSVYRRWAYAFLVGGGRPTQGGSDYRGYLYSVVAAAHKLRQLNTTADIVLMVKITTTGGDDGGMTKLTHVEERLLKRQNIHIHYLPTGLAKPNMGTIPSPVAQDKFQILTLTQYSRVMFLDNDIFPRCNLDYIFDLSEPLSNRSHPLLWPNIVCGWNQSPAYAGLFVLQPQNGDYDKLQAIIAARQGQALQWDEVDGWGHRIVPPDYRVLPSGEMGTNWTWEYAFAENGLLYHWTKYVKRSVSLISPGKIENWGSALVEETKAETFRPECPRLTFINPTNNVDLAPQQATTSRVCKEETLRDILEEYSCRRTKREKAPYRDIVHFKGSRKPWLYSRTRLEMEIQDKSLKDLNGRQKWYWHLKQAIAEAGMQDEVSMDFMSP